MYLPAEIDERLRKQFDFVVEIDKAKNIYRRNLIADGSRNENDAEHMWHMALTAMILSEYAEKDVDMNKVIRMALVHDLVEVYAGDTFAYDEKGYTDKLAREIAAADKLFAILPTEQGAEMRALWEEFDAGETKEACFANAIDRITPMLQNHLTDGHTWKLGKVQKSKILERAKPIEGYPKLYDVFLYILNNAIEKGHIAE